MSINVTYTMATSTTDMVTLDLNATTYDYVVDCPRLREDLLSTASRNYWLVAILSIYFVIGFFGNGILVVLFMMEKNLRDINNALITNLAASDFLYVGLFVPILIFSEFYRFRPFGKTFCIISIVTNYTSQDVSTLSLASLSYFRYCAVVWPFRSRMKSRSKLIFTFCLLSWLIGAVFSIYPATACEEHPERDCFVWGRHRVQVFAENKAFYIFFWIRFSIFYLLPLFIIAFFYGRVAYTLFTASTTLGENESVQANNQAASRSRKKLSVVVLIIVVTFFVSWIPTYVYWLNGLDDNYFIGELNTVRKVTMFIPATMNPIILFVTSTSYRKGFLNFCFCGGLKSTVTLGTSTFTTQLRTRLSVATSRNGNHVQSSSLESKTDTMKDEPEQI